jgi:hypothetical protein
MTEKFRGQIADIEVDDGGTDVPVGIIDDPEVTVSKNIEQLRGAGSVTWEDLMQTEVEVSVSGTIMQWDLDTWKTLVGYDEVADKLDDTADVPTVDVTVIYEDTSGDTAEFEVTEAFSEDLTIGGSREEWIGLELDVTGKTVKNVDDNSSTAGAA